jgi:hypothetical protein
MHLRPISFVALFFVSLAGSWGCSSASGELPTLIPTKGKVTYKGKPLTSGVVRFEPDGYGRAAAGRIESDGSFVLRTYKDGDGVVPGSHRVYVTETADKTLARDRAFKKFTQPTTSGVTAEVSAEKTEFTIDLK